MGPDKDLCWNGEKEKAWRMIEEPTPGQVKCGGLVENQELVCYIFSSNQCLG